jgi:ElaB/YqjD/DUF883 family membrane-anchored ribosome-binding protein
MCILRENEAFYQKERVKLDSNIIIFPDFQTLSEEVERLRIELSMLLEELDELQYVICKNIETKYMLLLGGLEYKVYEAQCAALRLKRKTEMIQAKKNRQEKISLVSIEKILDEEFAEYQKQLSEQIARMNEALEYSKARTLSKEEGNELKKIYHSIVKTLHPDINPQVTAAEREMFDRAVNAYKMGDLNTLRIIGEMVGERHLPENGQTAMTQLMDEKKRLEGMIKNVRERMERIKSEYPYTVKDIVDDPEKVKQRKAELEQMLSEYNEIIDIYKERLAELLR